MKYGVKRGVPSWYLIIIHGTQSLFWQPPAGLLQTRARARKPRVRVWGNGGIFFAGGRGMLWFNEGGRGNGGTIVSLHGVHGGSLCSRVALATGRPEFFLREGNWFRFFPIEFTWFQISFNRFQLIPFTCRSMIIDRWSMIDDWWSMNHYHWSPIFDQW